MFGKNVRKKVSLQKRFMRVGAREGLSGHITSEESPLAAPRVCGERGERVCEITFPDAKMFD